MSTPGSPNLLLMRQAAAAVPAGPFQLPASCKISEDDTASLKRTFPVAGNRKTWTWSAWIKLGKIGDDGYIFAARSDNNNRIYLKYQSDGTLYGYTGNSNSKQFQTTRKLRDPSAWFHLVWVWDSSLPGERNRQVVWINGERTTNTQSNSYTQDFEGAINDAIGHCICNAVHVNQIFDAYLSDVQFVDGMALHPSCWGEFSSTTGDWNPKAFSLQTYNNGRTWSDDTSNLTNPANAFDGNTAVGSSTASSGAAQVSITFDPPLTNVADFEHNSANGGTHMWAFNGGPLVEDSGGSTSYGNWRRPPAGMKVPSTINSFQVRYGPADDDANVSLAGIRVNGVVLVDGKTDNSASINDGRVWSTYMSATGGWLTTNTPDRTFNGVIPNMGNSGVSTYGNDVGGTITFAPTGGIAYKDKVELYTDQGSNYTVNGGSSQSFGPASGQSNGTWYTVATGSGTLNTLTWTPQNSGSYRPSSAAMRIDGQLLIDGVQSIYGRNGYKLLSDGFSASRAADIGKDYANGLISTANGGKPILTTTDDPNYGDTTAGAVATDSLSSSLKFAIAGNSTANITDDKSGNSNDPTKSGTVVTNGNESRFYGTSMDFGNNAGRLFVNDADVTIGTNQFCMEGWFYPTNSDGNNKTALSGNWSGTQGFLLCFDRSDVANDGWCLIQGTSSSSTTITAASTHPIDTWTHVAVTRDSSNKIRLFVNGVEEASATNTNNIATTEFGIGSVYSGSQTEGWDGLVQDVRLYVGASKYEASFTPPIRNDWRAVNLHPVPPAAPEIKYFKFRGSYNSTGYSHTYSIEYSDDNSSWTEAWNGDASTAGGACLLTQGTGGGGSYGTHRYWRFKCGTTNNSGGHFPRVSRLVLTDSNGIDHLLVKFVDDNCSDSGTIPANSSTYARDFQTSEFIDICTDTPTSYGTGTSGGDVRGNFAVLNPLNKHNSADTVTDGNLAFTTSSGGGISESTIAMSSGKYYYEAVFSGGQGNNQFAGIRKAGGKNYDDSYIYVGTGTKYTDGASGTSYGAGLANGDVIGVAFDADNGTLTFYKNGATQGTAFTGISTTAFPYSFITGSWGSSPTYTVNFGQRKFAYTPPTNFLPLCSQNLPTPTIANPAEYMTAIIYTGDGQDDRPLTLGFKPGMIWQKKRNGSDSHHVIDQVRGGSDVLYTDADSAANAQGGDGAVNAWTATGVELNDEVGVNQNNSSFVMWGWEANTTFSNSAGTNSATIASEGRYNANTGFSIVKYVSTGTSNTKVFHKLSAAPKFIIIKNFDGTQDWGVYHAGIGNADGILLNTNAAKQGSPSNWWNSTSPDNNVFTLGNKDTVNNSSSHDYIAYCWSEVAGFSSFGTYEGNNSSDGTYVHCGFAPKLVVVKTTNTTGNWVMYDRARLRYNPNPYVLLADVPDGGSTHDAWVGSYPIDFLSNGFKLRANTGEMNGTNDFIYMAWAESPCSTARAR